LLPLEQGDQGRQTPCFEIRLRSCRGVCGSETIRRRSDCREIQHDPIKRSHDRSFSAVSASIGGIVCTTQPYGDIPPPPPLPRTGESGTSETGGFEVKSAAAKLLWVRHYPYERSLPDNVNNPMQRLHDRGSSGNACHYGRRTSPGRANGRSVRSSPERSTSPEVGILMVEAWGHWGGNLVCR
jgi:hypothetical protein